MAGLAAGPQAEGQTLQLGVVDFYGLSTISREQARAALTFAEGDTITLSDGQAPAVFRATEDRLKTLRGVVAARVSVVCCDAGQSIVYVGIQERGAPALRFRRAPQGSVRVPDEVARAGQDFESAFAAALGRGDAAEDHSQGHALMHDPAARAIQQQFVRFARRDLTLLRRVLRESSDAGQRALAAQVLGYAADKQAVVDDLVSAMQDPGDEVRNNAMRALMVFAETPPGQSGPAARVPAKPFLALLHSPVWTDRNKASMALLALSAGRDPKMLGGLRESLGPLVEMARWRVAGHALPAFLILARVAGYSDDDARRSWDQGEREAVIAAASRAAR